MADYAKIVAGNVSGNFFVDSSCINCDACRQLAPRSFEEVDELSAVTRQPESGQEIHRAYQALLACPVGSIGSLSGNREELEAARASFPIHLDAGVYYCGFNSEKSFGANSFFIRHPAGNWLVDSPRYLKPLVDAFEKLGGVSYIFLTHEDDVADADRYARRFKARRIIHRADAQAAPDAEWIVEGHETIRLASQFQAIPVPGHTEGSLTLLYAEHFLFTGDHMWWEPKTGTLAAPLQLVWSARHLLASIEKLLEYRFTWVLAGHGDRVNLPAKEMNAQVRGLLKRRHSAIPGGLP
jgi:glyoxylase-like metal-dependent hydrolase (beta-lactamase superfamily II)/ferredoxin